MQNNKNKNSNNNQNDQKESKTDRATGSKTLQLILVFTFSLILFFLLTKPFKSFKSTDESPSILSMTPQKIISFGGFPSEIIVGSYIREIGFMDIEKKTLKTDLTVWFRFDPKSISLSRIEAFSIDNADIKYKSEAKTRTEGKYILAMYNLTIELTLDLDYANFPFDDHIINFCITNYGLSPDEATFESSKSNFVLDKKINISGWEIIDRFVKTGFIEDTLNPKNKASTRIHPRTIFSIVLNRVGARHFITILFPLILIFFIATFTLSFDPTDSTVGIAIACISAIVAQRFIIEDMAPKSNNLMVSDKLYLLFLLASCIIFFISVFSSKISGFYKNIITILLYCFMLVSIIYIINPFI